MSGQAVSRMTVEHFLAWQAGQEQRYELVDGQPIAMAGARLRHDRVTGNALFELRRQFRAAGNPCDAFTADIGIRTRAGNIRRPDASVICPPFDEDAMTSDRPRLILEVLSQSTERVDRLLKLDEYKSVSSLGAIVIVDPTRIEVGFWTRTGADAWTSEVLREPEALLAVPDLGLALMVAALYERVPLPPG
ncbi:MAG: Uma2 family endonuclease [Gemmatimonadaceae bacterium]|nr:Uma2 family endonuclease [Acetobacteraceae bacterium]